MRQLSKRQVLGIIAAAVSLVNVWTVLAQTDPGDPALPPSLPETVAPARREPAAGDEVQVDLKTGERLEGEFVTQDERQISLRISGVVLRIERSSMERMLVLAPPAERYRKMRAQIANDDAERLVVLAEWLQRRRMYAEALAEIETALAADPTNAEGLRLKDVVAQLAALAARKGTGEAQEIERERQIDEAKRFPTRPRISEFPLLDDEQINLMKVYEVDLRDPPKMTISRETIQRMIVRFSDDPLIPEGRDEREAFFTRPPEEVLDVMFRLRARDMYDQVRVLDHPRSMRLFRDHVHAGWLISSCGSTACHGGSDSGRFQLFNYRPTADASVYTNFLIMDRFRSRDDRPLVDYEEPERSLLLQMALPRDEARSPHPRVPGWQPAFRNREARRYLQTIEWIRSMYRPRPEYPIDYKPPGTRVDGEEGSAPKDPVER